MKYVGLRDGTQNASNKDKYILNLWKNMHEKGAQLKKLSVINARRQSTLAHNATWDKHQPSITEVKDSDNENQFLGAVTSDSLTHGMSKLR